MGVHRVHHERELLLLGLIAACLTALAACSVAAGGTGAAAVPAVALATASTSPQSLPPDKQAYLDRQAQMQVSTAAMAANAGITKASAPTPPPLPPGATALAPMTSAGDGTIVDSSASPPGVNAKITNRWYEQLTTGDFVVVFAGAPSGSTTTGLVLVTAGPGTPARTFTAPGHHGALTILGAGGQTLSLRAADGTLLSFDVSTLSFG